MKRGKPLNRDPEKTRAWQQRSRTRIVTRVREPEVTADERPGGDRPWRDGRPGRLPVSGDRAGRRRDTAPRPRATPRRNDAPWRAAVLAEHGPACVACGDTAHVQADHLWPRSQGGPSDVRNGLPLCGEFSRVTPGGCHPAKTAGRLQIRPAWLSEQQRRFLADAGWVVWDDAGRPLGRGWRHFTDQDGTP